MTTDSTFLDSIDEPARRRFEQARREGRAEPIEHFLPPEDHPKYVATLQELIQIELEFAWKAAARAGFDWESTALRPAPVESYLSRFPCLSDPAVLRRLARQEFEVRRRYGHRPDPGDYRRRFPDQGDFAESDSPGPALAAGARVGRYRLCVEYARGSFGLVWRADDDALGREVALKQLSPDAAADPGLRQRFVAEARIAAQLQHPGVVPVYDVGEGGGEHPFYTMKLVRGHTLTEAIGHFHAASPAGGRAVEQLRLLTAFVAVARTMAFAHSRHVIHRDLKPDNIVLGDYGETVILDWGLAKVLGRDPEAALAAAGNGAAASAAATQLGTVIGTPAYMAPEQASGRPDVIDERSDVYALGAILFHILTSRLPFTGASTAEVLRRVLESEPPRPRSLEPKVPRPLEAICLRAMAKRPEDRYSGAAALADDLERYLADEPVSAYRGRWAERVGRWARRHRTVVVTGCVVLVLSLAAVAAGLYLWREEEQRREREAEQHLADRRRSALDAEAFALADLRRGRYESAEALFNQGLLALGDEPRLQEVSERLRSRRDRARGLVEYYRLADESERLAFLEYDPESVFTCERALAALGILDDLDWLDHLPADLGGQLDQLQEDVYRTLSLLGALRARAYLTAKADAPGAKEAYRSALVALAQAYRKRRSFSGHLLELFCHAQLGEYGALTKQEVAEPTSATDYYFSGMAHLWLASAGANDPILKLLQLPFFRAYTGLDFEHPRDTAERQLRTAADMLPQHYWSRVWLGWSLGQAGDFKSAADAFDTCVALRLTYALGYAERGRMLLLQGQPNDPPARRGELERRGVQDLDRAVALDPHEPYLFFLRAVMLRRLGRTGPALDAFARMMALERPLSAWEGQRIATEKRGYFEAARDFASPLTGSDETAVEANALLAAAQLALGRPGEAFDAVDAALKRRPDHARALAVRGAASLEKKDYPAALADFRAALAGAPDDYQAALGQAKAHEALGQWAEALAAFDDLPARVVFADWQRVEAHLGRARALARLGRADEARAALETARSLNPRAAAAQPIP